MNDRLVGGIAAAALFGAMAGIALSPAKNRGELRHRLRTGLRRVAYIMVHDRERIGLAVGLTVTKIADLTRYAIDRVGDYLAGSPITQIKRALARDARLRRRSISVDAIGNIILLQGAVEDDDEWRAADLLARSAIPEGTIRNHLHVSRSAPAD